VRPSLVRLTPAVRSQVPGEARTRERVETDPRPNPSRRQTTVAKGEGYAPSAMAWEDPNGKLRRAACIIETDQILARNTERLGGLRAHERGVVPK